MSKYNVWKDSDIKQSLDEFNLILNKEPLSEWIRILPGTNIKYIPITILEWQMTSIFGSWYVEVLEYKELFNNVSMTVRVHYYHPVLEEDMWVDGGSASPIVKDNEMGVAMAMSAAKTFAFKDAVECLGKIFGKDLNRPDDILYNNLAKKTVDVSAIMPKLVDALSAYKGTDQLAIQAQILKANKEGWTNEFLKEITAKLNVTL